MQKKVAQVDDDEEYEGPDFKRAVLQNTKHVVDIFCIWDCTKFWIRFRCRYFSC